MKVLLLSDIHGNWPALQAVLAAEPDADQILCLGDLVNYGPQPAECVAWAMQLNSPSRVIQGNHDRAFGLGNVPGCASFNQQLAEAMQSATNSLLAIEMKQFLAKLQPLQTFHWNAASCVACHLAFTSSIRPGLTEHDHPGWQETELTRMDTDMILVGHPDMLFVLLGHPDFVFLGNSHLPVKVKNFGTLVVNPGSVGLPADGDPRAAYAVWQDGTVIFHRAPYDIEETVRACESLDLAENFKRQLADELRIGTCLSMCKAAELAMKDDL